jgi:LmbE family N-acetylglucosaminyl deacetylase
MRVLAIGAHPDDVELGCGGALLRHLEAGDEVTMFVMTPGEHGPQGLTTRIREQEAAAAVLGAQLVWGPFTDGSIPHGREAVVAVDEMVTRLDADVIYTHAPNDTHQDHVATSAAALAGARRLARILYYQSPSTTSFDPTVFVDVERTLSGKLAALRAHWSQVMLCPMVDLEAVEVGARFWGTRAKTCYAEAFETPRFVWDIGHGAEPGVRTALSDVVVQCDDLATGTTEVASAWPTGRR